MKVIATRLHTLNGNEIKDTGEIYKWCQNSLKFFDKVLITVDCKYYEILKESGHHFKDDIELVYVPNWTGFTQPLNMTVESALSIGGKSILFQSIEVDVSLDDTEILHSYLDEETLVVGGKLNEKHGAEFGNSQIHGWNTPWNTLAFWDLEKLALTGFLSVSSGNLDDIAGAIEEVVTISLLQKLKPDSMDAKLVSLPSLFWETKWTCREREKYHQEKMNSKDERAKVQLEKLNLEPGIVMVLE